MDISKVAEMKEVSATIEEPHVQQETQRESKQVENVEIKNSRTLQA